VNGVRRHAKTPGRIFTVLSIYQLQLLAGHEATEVFVGNGGVRCLTPVAARDAIHTKRIQLLRWHPDIFETPPSCSWNAAFLS
jgi:hypothetical protein